MKKCLVVLMVFLLLLSIVGCSKEKAETSSAESTEDVKRIALLIPGSLGDKSYFDSAQAGMDAVGSEYGSKVELKTFEVLYDETKWEPALLSASEEGYDLIITIAWGMAEYLQNVAADFPEIDYVILDTVADGDNIHSVVYRPNEGAYLAGILAAEMAKTKIGFLGGQDIPLINDFLVGYVQGARSIQPDIKVDIAYIGDWQDTAKGKELALAQYRGGVDVGFNVAGKAGLGQIDAAYDAGKLAIGVDSDQAVLFEESSPERAERIISSAVKDVGASLARVVDQYMNGTLQLGTVASMGVAEGIIYLADNKYYQELVSEEVRDKIAAVQEKIAKGEIRVDSISGMTPDELNEIRKSVR